MESPPDGGVIPETQKPRKKAGSMRTGIFDARKTDRSRGISFIKIPSFAHPPAPFCVVMGTS
jgi:hypothetical protein